MRLCQCFSGSWVASPQCWNSCVPQAPTLKKGQGGSICPRHLSSLAPLQMSHWINGFLQVGATEWEKETFPKRNHHRLQMLKPSSREKGELDNKLTMTCPPAHLCQLSQSKDSPSSPDQTCSLSRNEQSPSRTPCVAHVSVRQIWEKWALCDWYELHQLDSRGMHSNAVQILILIRRTFK